MWCHRSGLVSFFLSVLITAYPFRMVIQPLVISCGLNKTIRALDPSELYVWSMCISVDMTAKTNSCKCCNCRCVVTPRHTRAWLPLLHLSNLAVGKIELENFIIGLLGDFKLLSTVWPFPLGIFFLKFWDLLRPFSKKKKRGLRELFSFSFWIRSLF